MRGFAVSLALVTGFAPGCSASTLDVRVATPPAPAQVRSPCADTPRDCLRAGQPSIAIELPGATSIAWARVSPDGGLLVASVGTRDVEGAPRWVVAAVDLAERREIWRVELTKDGRAAAADAFFFASGVLLTTAGTDGATPAVVLLDPKNGRVEWSRSAPSPRRAADLQVLDADEAEGKILITETTRTSSSWAGGPTDSVRLVDARTGEVSSVLCARESSVSGVAPLRSYGTRDATYVLDRGLARIPRSAHGSTWTHYFATSERIVPGHAPFFFPFLIPLGGLHFMIGAVSERPEGTGGEEIGRTTEPVEVEGKVCTGSLGVLACFDAATGAMAWARRFPVTQFQSLAGTQGSLCAIAGGRYVVVRGEERKIEESRFHGLYCVRPTDGAPIEGFASALSTHGAGIPMTEEVLASYDPSSDNAALAERGAPEGEKELRFGAMAAVQSGVLVSQDDRVHLVVLPSGGTASTTDLHDLGDIRHFARARDVIVASGARGFAAFDAATGAFRWKRTVFRSRVSVVPLALHDLPGLVREDEPFREEVPVGEGESHPVNVYWTLPDAGWIVAPGHNGTLVGISLDDGAVIWELPAEGQVAVDASPASPAAVVIGRGEIRIYPIPRGPTLE